MFYNLEKLSDQAIAFNEELAEDNDPYHLMHLAFYADQANNAKRRDALLNRILTDGPNFKNPRTGHSRPELLLLAKTFATDLRKNGKANFSVENIEKKCVEKDSVAVCNFHYFLGRYLARCGKSNAAIEQWRKCMKCRSLAVDVRILAGDALVASGVKPEDYDNPLIPPKHRSPPENQ